MKEYSEIIDAAASIGVIVCIPIFFYLIWLMNKDIKRLDHKIDEIAFQSNFQNYKMAQAQVDHYNKMPALSELENTRLQHALQVIKQFEATYKRVDEN